MANDQALHNAAELGIAALYAELIADENRTSSMTDGYHRGHQDAYGILVAKKASRDTDIQKYQRHSLAVPDTEMAALDAAVARAKFEVDAAGQVMNEHSRKVAIPAKDNIREAGFYINTQTPHVRLVEPPSVTFGEARQTLDSATASIIAKRAEKRNWRDRPAPLESVRSAALANLDALCVPIMPTVGADGHLGWDSSGRGLDIRGHDKIELIHDARSFYLADSANKKRVVDHIERTLGERYANVTDTATETEKRVALSRLDGEILELQRVQVAAIRAIRATGEWVPFPVGIDVRALLNLAGPKPRSRD